MCAAHPLVLIVDDDRDVCHHLQIILESAGYGVVVAVDAAEAMRCLSAAIPDLVILDEGLPGCGGLEVFSDIRAHKELNSVPVLIYSGYDGVVRQQAIDAGVDAYVVKGLASVDELFQVVVTLLHSPARASSPRSQS